MTRRTAWVCVLLAAACGDERMAAPPAATLDGSARDVMLVPDPPTGRSDAGGETDAASETDAATEDGGFIAGCEEIAPGDPSNQLTVFDEGASTPFELSTAFVRWGDDCASPVLFIGLTDGSCVPRVGRQLLFAIDRDAIGTEIVEGDLVLAPDPTPLRVTFSRPVTDAAETRDSFGTCSADVLGTVTVESLGETADSVWTARFSGVELPHCDPARADTVLVEGSFSLLLPETFDTACP